VTGIDAAEENVGVAGDQARRDPFLDPSRLRFIHTTAERLVQEKRQFDIVCALEVIEHVNDPSAFLASCAHLVKVRFKNCTLLRRSLADGCLHRQ
jgi:2-polyprenyl-6-hydroxyphenyl methylase/3-demethylubiquinone-9 3-methyltransferase